MKTEDKLDRIFSLQNKLDEKIMSSSIMPISSKESMLKGLAIAITHEAMEFHDCFHWKWWKHGPGAGFGYKEEEAKEELVDIWHFLVSATIKLGMTPSDVLEEYEKKNKINHERQEQGY